MNNTIKISYYDKFKCIADKCPYTCCQEWSISVDEETQQKWAGVRLGQTMLCDCLENEEEGRIISLGKDHKCQFLDEKKLCRLVVGLGEDFLSETCETYPRLISEFEDRIEYSLDFGCPAVIDLLNENLEYIQFEQRGTRRYKSSIPYLVREMMFTIIKDESYYITERLMMIFCCLLELLEEGEVTKEIINTHNSKEYLNALADTIRKMRFNLIDSFWERNEVFLDLIQVYREQELYTEYLEEMVELAERLEEHYSDEELLDANQRFEIEYAAYEKLLQGYLIAEIFSSVLDEEMDLRDVVMVFEWIALVYSVVKQTVFLRWVLGNQRTIDYNLIRENIMMVSRMGGYSKEDIKAYLENSFEELIWEWGYLALVVGNSKL